MHSLSLLYVVFFALSLQTEASQDFADPLIDSPGKTIGSDFNGDGIHDFIVAGNYVDEVAVDAGAAYIFFGASSLSGAIKLGGGQSADVTILGKAANDRLGKGASGIGDVNGDGIDDIIVGAIGNDDQADLAGAAYVFFGATNLSGTKRMGGVQSADVTILGKALNDRLGTTAGVGDVNGDGFDDFIVATPQTSAGTAYVFFGASNLSGTKKLGGGASADVTILGKASGDTLGFDVSGAGDVNGDGFDDIITGGRQNDDAGADAGAAYVFFGASNLSGTKNLGGGASADVTVLGKAAGDRLGLTISGAGDVNGDGFDDVFISAYSNDEVATDAGVAYVFFGSSSLSGTKKLGGGQSADVTILGKATSNFLGRLVSNAGDLNDDGFDDIMVGAYRNSDVATYSGATYVFFGASNLSGTKKLGGGQSADLTILGKAAYDYLGLAAAGIGDVNANGIPDIITGAYGNDDQASRAGAAYVIFGGTTISGTKRTVSAEEDVRILGKATNNDLGNVVGGGRSNPGL